MYFRAAPSGYVRVSVSGFEQTHLQSDTVVCENKVPTEVV